MGRTLVEVDSVVEGIVTKAVADVVVNVDVDVEVAADVPAVGSVVTFVDVGGVDVLLVLVAGHVS